MVARLTVYSCLVDLVLVDTRHASRQEVCLTNRQPGIDFNVLPGKCLDVIQSTPDINEHRCAGELVLLLSSLGAVRKYRCFFRDDIGASLP